MTLVFVLGCAILILAGVALSYGRLASAADPEEFQDGWHLEFDPRRYNVLIRLVSGADLHAARSWRGMTPRLEKQLRRQRAASVSAYLREMRADFLRLETLGRLMVLSGAASLEFRQSLVQAKLDFTLAWWRLRLECFFWRLGLGQARPARLVAVFDSFVKAHSDFSHALASA